MEDGEFSGKSTLQEFLFYICRNLWRRHEKDRAKEKGAIDAFGEITGDEYDLEYDDGRYERASMALTMLEEACRNILDLYYVREMRMQEIAVQLEFKSETTARTRKFKCLDEAKKIYQKLTTSQTADHEE